MYSKDEVKQLKYEFWKRFDFRMKKYTKVFQKKIDWTKYNTRVKEIYLRMNVDRKTSTVSIDIQSKDNVIRYMIYEKMEEFRGILNKEFDNRLLWQKDTIRDEMIISRISIELNDIDYFVKENTDEIVTFLETNIVKFFKFWEEYGEIVVLYVKP